MAKQTNSYKEWRFLAERDLTVANHLAVNIYPPQNELSAYLCQQSIEKYLKGALILLGENDIPYTHDLSILCLLAEKHKPSFSAISSFCASIKHLSVSPRYDAGLSLSDTDMRLVLQYAQKVKVFLEKEVPSLFQDLDRIEQAKCDINNAVQSGELNTVKHVVDYMQDAHSLVMESALIDLVTNLVNTQQTPPSEICLLLVEKLYAGQSVLKWREDRCNGVVEKAELTIDGGPCYIVTQKQHTDKYTVTVRLNGIPVVVETETDYVNAYHLTNERSLNGYLCQCLVDLFKDNNKYKST